MKKAILAVLTGICCLAAIVSGNAIIYEQNSKAKAVASFTELREARAPAAVSPADTEERPTPREVYAELAEENPDLAGWVKIEGTPIDYPVMQTPADPEFYLDHGFDKSANVYGVPFADPACDLSAADGNIIVYGHNMFDGQMFAALLKYGERSYFQAHQRIVFDTLEEFGLYQIVAVLQVTVTKGDPAAVDFSQYAYFEDEEEFAAFTAMCGEAALYATGQSIEATDRLLILSTCEYSEPNGRMVLVAKKLPV